MFVGDSLINDIRGANRMGMISVLKGGSGRSRPWLARPRHRICCLAQLPRLLAESPGRLGQ
jgi:FMN phosphatase YigB (HAD superfamily)